MIDVLIIGAGPTGLTMALECARYGLNCQIIDSALQPSCYSKAIAIQARSLETFQRMGIHTRFLEEGICLTGANIHSNHKKQARVDLSFIPSLFPFVLSIEQNKTERILIDYLTEQGIQIQRDTKLLHFQEQNEHIVAITNRGTFKAHYLIGCDGAHSLVRKTMGCKFKGKAFSDIFSLADVLIDWEKPHDEISVFLESTGIVAAFPLPQAKRYRLIFQLKRLRGVYQIKEHPSGILEPSAFDPPNLEEIHALLFECIKQPFKISDPRWIANFHINSHLSNVYRKNNIFLAGDAAHIHSPVGGQGMNTGIQDAFNLAWKIAYVHLHKVDKALLDTYELERRALGKQLLRATEKASQLISLHTPFLISLRNYLLSNMLSFEWVQKKIVTAISELNIGYPRLRVPNYTIIQEGKERDYFSISEKSTQYHLLSSDPKKFKPQHQHIQPLQVKEKIRSPILVRPDGYPAVMNAWA